MSEQMKNDLTATFNWMMEGDEWCVKHNIATVKHPWQSPRYCPQCAAETEEADKRRTAKMNADIAFGDWHARTDD